MAKDSKGHGSNGHRVEKTPDDSTMGRGRFGVRTASGGGFMSYHDTESDAKKAASGYKKASKVKSTTTNRKYT